MNLLNYKFLLLKIFINDFLKDETVWLTQKQMAEIIHYGSVVGTKQDATDFIKLLHPSIKGIILMKQ